MENKSEKHQNNVSYTLIALLNFFKEIFLGKEKEKKGDPLGEIRRGFRWKARG